MKTNETNKEKYSKALFFKNRLKKNKKNREKIK
jgi:hypothetical protein